MESSPVALSEAFAGNGRWPWALNTLQPARRDLRHTRGLCVGLYTELVTFSVLLLIRTSQCR